MQDTTPDSELVRRAKAGELAAFEELTNRYERRVYTLALRIVGNQQDAEDVTQQTFLSVLDHIGEFRGDSSFATWLFRVATNAALKVLRKRRGLDTVSLEEATEPQAESDKIPHPEYIADWRQSPDTLAQQAETRQLLEQA
ncbi:MAG: sigma-70 family RNA polymerase sigma factor, partial [Verrucomicrobiae bacterium]|nr:sigma-70 family RNA polymerase sigma factor [Verrucomicrobiae bacterium]MDW7979747.1 sigma-70 family RNA polymerase sigma factor [Verrucomicrobiales bacterium]